jgi:flavorubredoxin
MADILFENDEHKCVFFEDFSEGEMVPSNQHLIIHKGVGMLLDPGGHKIYSKVFSALPEYTPPSRLKYLFLSHQDPDIVASLNAWMMVTDADAYLPQIWTTFVAHFGIDSSAMKRMCGIPDQGRIMDLEGCSLQIIPAHFLHSAGNFHVYDPISKILYSGDLGAAVVDYRFVEDFDTHAEKMLGFHQRYMASSTACKLWAKMARQLDIEIIAPQHGAMFVGKDKVGQFIDWVEGLEVGAEYMQDIYQVPTV